MQLPARPANNLAYRRDVVPGGTPQGFDEQRQLEPPRQDTTWPSFHQSEWHRPMPDRGGEAPGIARTLAAACGHLLRIIGVGLVIAAAGVIAFNAVPVKALLNRIAPSFGGSSASPQRTGTQATVSYLGCSNCNGRCVHCPTWLAITGDKGNDLIRCDHCGGTMPAIIAIQKYHYCLKYGWDYF